MTSSSTGIPQECALKEGASISSDCGIFVQKGATGDGSQASPLGSITEALALSTAQNSRIYICGGDTFTGSVTVPPGVSLFGGLSCADWKFAGTNSHPVIAGDADAPAVHLSGGSVSVDSIDVAASAATKDGGSSIGVLAEDADFTLTRATVTAGSPKAGLPGVTPTTQLEQAVVGAMSMNAGCTSGASVDGGAGGIVACGADQSVGGDGGKGTANGGVNSNGLQGDATPPPGSPATNFGTGETSMSSCMPGTVGVTGAPGQPGAGPTGYGSLSSSGFGTADGLPGTSRGRPGQGGGGGGGARGASHCATTTNAGPSGGGGGSGGCGGYPGGGGQGGGSSIAIALIGGSLTVQTGVKLVTADGGAGGPGSSGQAGANGANGGNPGGTGACGGGFGGQGGRGGAGGGGGGGHSIGVASTGGTLTLDSSLETMLGQGGALGAGGDGGTMNQGGSGDPGKSCRTMDFSKATAAEACMN